VELVQFINVDIFNTLMVFPTVLHSMHDRYVAVEKGLTTRFAVQSGYYTNLEVWNCHG